MSVAVMRASAPMLTSAVGLLAMLEEQEAQIKELNENFSKQVEDLQKLYEGYMKDKEAAEAALKGQGLGLAKAVRKSLEAKTDEL